MRLLFVTPQIPWPPTQGTALRNFHLLKAAASAHEVDLLSFDHQSGGPRQRAIRGPAPAGDPKSGGPRQRAIENPLERLCRRIETVPAPVRSTVDRLRDLALNRADMERRLWSPAFAARLAALLRAGAYDAVQLEGFEVAGYLLGPAALRAEALGSAPWATRPSALTTDHSSLITHHSSLGSPAPLLVFDDHNAEYQLQETAARIDAASPRRWARAAYSAVQARRLRRREALYCAAADACLAVSDADAAALEAICPGLGAAVVPNGVDCAARPPPRAGAEAPHPTVFFAGKLDYRPNVDACIWLVREILPRVRATVPDVRLVLAGRDPSPAVQRLASAPGGWVEVTGALAGEELARRRAAAWVYVVPMRMGSGVRFKVLEAMAAGVPLVATSLGAAGSGAAHGRHALIADDAEAFAAAVADLLRDSQMRARLAAAARALAVERHDWRHVTPKLLALYDRLQAPPRRRVSLIGTVLNERASVPPLLASLEAQTRPPDEVVVVDGGSTDGTAEDLEACAAAQAPPRVRLVCAPGANISQGRNRAILAARSDTIAATDAGVVLDAAWLARLTAPLERCPPAGALQATSGFFVAAPQSTWELALGAATLPSVGEIDPARFLPSSRSFAFRRAAWEQAGGYPEWLDYCEDVVFDLALRGRGVAMRFVPRAVVHFRPRATPRAFFGQYFRYARGDGKAGLWPRRHAIRYASYALGAGLLWRICAPGRDPGRGRAAALAVLLAGGAAYLARPTLRLAERSRSAGDFWRAAPLLPVARVTGDVGKMVGYPAGLAWRLRHRR